jgi:hypothetical protein
MSLSLITAGAPKMWQLAARLNPTTTVPAHSLITATVRMSSVILKVRYRRLTQKVNYKNHQAHEAERLREEKEGKYRHPRTGVCY